jgi:Phage integrase, N-terminal SAM-like domain
MSIRPSILTIGDKTAAKNAARNIQRALVSGKTLAPEQKKTTPTVKEYFEQFKAAYLDGAAVRFNTQRINKNSFTKHILPALGSKRLDEITREDLQRLIAELVGQKLAKDTIRLVLANMSFVFNYA